MSKIYPWQPLKQAEANGLLDKYELFWAWDPDWEALGIKVEVWDRWDMDRYASKNSNLLIAPLERRPKPKTIQEWKQEEAESE
jgi:hypothetical protein